MEFDTAIKLQLMLGWIVDIIQVLGIIGIVAYISKK